MACWPASRGTSPMKRPPLCRSRIRSAAFLAQSRYRARKKGIDHRSRGEYWHLCDAARPALRGRSDLCGQHRKDGHAALHRGTSCHRLHNGGLHQFRRHVRSRYRCGGKALSRSQAEVVEARRVLLPGLSRPFGHSAQSMDFAIKQEEIQN